VHSMAPYFWPRLPAAEMRHHVNCYQEREVLAL
jgi:hypothetical protein